MSNANDDQRQRLYAAIARWLKDNALQICLASDATCSPGIARAHSIQSKYALASIANNGHVLMFQMDYGRPSLAMTGVNKASTFTGFCEHHDSLLFRAVDFSAVRPFDLHDTSQCTLLALRAVSREYWAKLNAKQFYSRVMSLVQRRDTQSLSRLLGVDDMNAQLVASVGAHTAPQLTGTACAAKRMSRNYSSLVHQLDVSRFHYSRFHHYLVPGPVNVAASAVFPLEFDLHGNRLCRRVLEPDLPEVALTIIPVGNDHAVLFHWHRRHDRRHADFFAELDAMPAAEREVTLSKMMIVQGENFALSPAFAINRAPREIARLEALFYRTLRQGVPYGDIPSVNFFRAQA